MSARSDPIRLSGAFDNRLVEATVSPVGASLQRLSVDGVELVYGSPDGPVASSGAVLVPWPNRVRGGRWKLAGAPQQLELTEPTAGNALHGLVATAPFSVIDRRIDSVVLGAHVIHPPGYPFDLHVTVSYQLTPSGVDSVIGVRNCGTRPAPAAVGVHPYLRVGNAAAKDLLLQLGAEQTLLLGDDNLPTGLLSVADSPYDLRRPTPVIRVPAHAAFTRLHLDGGRVRIRLIDRRSTNVAEVWADTRFRWVQVYITDTLPGTSPGRVAVALEPMTAPPDALNSRTDLQWLGPGAYWELSWGIRSL